MALTFEYKMEVRDYECDAQGVVNNANYLHYFEATRQKFLEKHGIRLRDLTEANLFPVVRNAHISYRKPLKGSDEFVCDVKVERKGIRYYFLQTIIRVSDNALCTMAEIEVVCLLDGKTVEPKLFDKAFADYLVWRK